MDAKKDETFTVNFVVLLNTDFPSKKSLCSLFPQAMEVLHNFKQSQAATKESILQADKALATWEKALAGTVQRCDH